MIRRKPEVQNLFSYLTSLKPSFLPFHSPNRYVENSVTRFGEDLNVFGQFFLIAYLVFGKVLYQLWHFYATKQIIFALNLSIFVNKCMARLTGGSEV